MNKTFNVLVVDNSRLFRSLLKELLDQFQFTTCFCSTAQEALEQTQNQTFDLICAAYHLSDMTGEQFCQQLRQQKNAENSRIILFTAEDNKDLLKNALLVGATDIYSKDQFDQFERYLKRLSNEACINIIAQVLLIEDSPSQLLWLKSILIEHGMDVDSFSNAEQAIDEFKQKDYDLVITDIVLEGSMSGLSMVREIRRMSSEKGLTPIFAMSAYNDISRRIELYHVGVNDYMTKPIIVEEFIYRVHNLIETQRMFNQLAMEQKQLQEIALLDPVTGLYNRNAFEQFASREIKNAITKKQAISLAILDLDYFKNVNDKYGHGTGDQVLADVGLWLRNTLRKGDMVFRWGGEEFVLLLIDCTPEDANKLLEKQRKRFNNRKYAGLSITASIGISGITNPENPKTTKQLFLEADKAVYAAKGAGRNRVCLES